MIHAMLNVFCPSLYQIIQSNVTITTATGKLAPTNNYRVALFAGAFPNVAVIDPVLQFNGASSDNPNIRIADYNTISLTWWTHIALVTQEIWLSGLAPPVTFRVTQVCLRPINRRSLKNALGKLAALEANVANPGINRAGIPKYSKLPGASKRGTAYSVSPK